MTHFSRKAFNGLLLLLLVASAGAQTAVNLGTQVKSQLRTQNGGTGTDTSTTNGCPKLVAGTWLFSPSYCGSGIPAAGVTKSDGTTLSPATVGDLNNLLVGAPSCTTAGTVYSPAAGACISGGSGGTALPVTQNVFAGNNAGGALATPLSVNIATGDAATPGVVSSSGGHTVATSCATLQDFQGTACTTHDITFHSILAGIDAVGIKMRIDGANAPGWNWGIYGGWSYHHGQVMDIVSSTRGIHDIFGENLTMRAAGDAFGHYAIVHSPCAAIALSDEGCGLYAGDLDDYNAYQIATVPAGVSGTGLTFLNPTHGSGPNFVIDESVLINTSRGVIHTNLVSQPAVGIAASALPNAGNNPLVHSVPVTAGSVPITTTYCYALQTLNGPMVAPAATANQGVAQNVVLSCTVQPIAGAYTPFPATGVVSVDGSNYLENAQIVSVGAMDPTSHIQSITVALRNPNESIALFYGGLAGGSYLNFDDDYNWTATANQGTHARQLFSAVGSLDGNSILYAYNSFGKTVVTAVHFPVQGMSIAGPASGISIFKGAEITAVLDNVNSATMEANNMVLAAGDTLEDPHPASTAYKLLSLNGNLTTPCDPSGDCSGIEVGLSGAGVGGATNGLVIKNYTNAPYYVENGGKTTSPTLIAGGGNWNNFAYMDTEPAKAVFSFNQPTANNPTGILSLFSFSYSGNRMGWKRDAQRFFVGPIDLLDGSSTAVTSPCTDHTTKIATTAYVANCVTSGGSSPTETYTAAATGAITINLATSTNTLVMTGDVTFTMAAGNGAQAEVLNFCQDATGSRRVTAPANVHGFMAPGLSANLCSSQLYNYSPGRGFWYAPGVINE